MYKTQLPYCTFCCRRGSTTSLFWLICFNFDITQSPCIHWHIQTAHFAALLFCCRPCSSYHTENHQNLNKNVKEKATKKEKRAKSNSSSDGIGWKATKNAWQALLCFCVCMLLCICVCVFLCVSIGDNAKRNWKWMKDVAKKLMSWLENKLCVVWLLLL